jgi:hypothetical protein
MNAPFFSKNWLAGRTLEEWRTENNDPASNK